MVTRLGQVLKVADPTGALARLLPFRESVKSLK